MDELEQLIQLQTLKRELAYIRFDGLNLEHLEPLRCEVKARLKELTKREKDAT